MKPTIVEIEWIDSAFNRGWGTLNEKRDAMSTSDCRTVGYLLDKTRTTYKIAQSLGDQDSAADGIAIPRVSVRRIRRLR